MKVYLWNHLAMCESVCSSVCVSLLKTFECLNQSLWNLVYVYHDTWEHLNEVLQKSLPTVILSFELLWVLRHNFNVAWTPLPIFVKLVMYITLHEAISRPTSQIPPINNTNNEVSQILKIITSLNVWTRSWNLAYISCHLRPSQRRTS
jgi:hypothetical protein